MQFRFLVAVSLLIGEIHSLKTAGPYELLYMYEAYKMDYRMQPANARTIATGCTQNAIRPNDLQFKKDFSDASIAAGVGGICRFGEFALHVLSSKAIKTNIRNSQALWTLNPNPTDVVNEIDTNLKWEQKKDKETKQTIMMPDGVTPKLFQKKIIYRADLITSRITLTTVSNVLEIPLPDTLEEVRIAIRDARVLALGQNIPLMDTSMTNAKYFLEATKHYRLEDQAGYKTDSMINSPEGAPFAAHWKYRDVTLNGPDGSTPLNTYQEIDIDKTFESAGTTVSQADRAALVQLSQGFSTSTPTSVIHYAVIDSVGTGINALHAPCQ